jgi:zinc protease
VNPLRRSGASALVLLAAAAPLAAQDYPKTPPAPGPLTPAPFPPFRETVLPSGLRILVVESHKQPIVSLSLSFAAGSIFDPAGKEGLSEMVAGLLTKGAGGRTAEQISEAIEGAGGSLSAGAGPDFLSINSTVLTSSLPLAMELIGDAAVRPAFPETEVELLRTQTLSGLQVALSQPESVADRIFHRTLYGQNPYGRSADPASIRATKRADLVAFQRSRLRPAGALLVVAGDVSLAQVRTLALKAFRGWVGAPPAVPVFRAPPSRASTELILVHRPGSVQSNIMVGNLTFLPGDPRTYSAAVANQVLGGGASSRLFLILREAKSWTYGAYSGYARRKGLGFFQARTEVRTEVTDSALKETLVQLRRIATEPVPVRELEDAKGSLTGSYPLSIESADQVAGAVANARLYGLAPDYVQTYRVRIGAVTASQVQSTAQATIRPNAAAIVVVGDGAKVYESLKGIAPVTIVDPEGNPLTPADLSPKVAALDLDLSALVPRRDSFSIGVQGNQLGWQRGLLEKTADGFRYTEDTHIATFVNQTTVLELDAMGRMKSVKQTGKVQGQDAMVDVVYAGGRAKGTASTPDPQTRAVKQVTIDTLVAEGTVDDNAVQALLPALKWKAGAKWTINVLSAGQAEIKPWTLTVAGTEPVTIGGKPVEAFRTELVGPPAPLTFWVSTAAPHVLLKIAIAGAPVDILRVP